MQTIEEIAFNYATSQGEVIFEDQPNEIYDAVKHGAETVLKWNLSSIENKPIPNKIVIGKDDDGNKDLCFIDERGVFHTQAKGFVVRYWKYIDRE